MDELLTGAIIGGGPGVARDHRQGEPEIIKTILNRG